MRSIRLTWFAGGWNKGLLHCYFSRAWWANLRKLRTSRLEVFCRKGVLKIFAKFTGKHLCQSLFFNNVAGLKRSFAKYLRAPFFTEYLRWLLLEAFVVNLQIYLRCIHDLCKHLNWRNYNKSKAVNCCSKAHHLRCLRMSWLRLCLPAIAASMNSFMIIWLSANIN